MTKERLLETFITDTNLQERATRQQIEKLRRNLVQMIVNKKGMNGIQEQDHENGLRRTHIAGNLHSEIDPLDSFSQIGYQLNAVGEQEDASSDRSKKRLAGRAHLNFSSLNHADLRRVPTLDVEKVQERGESPD